MHPRNPHAGRYDLQRLSTVCPELKPHIRSNPKGDATIDFSDEQAVICLNQALLADVYQVHHWQIPAGYLCPPIPGRADYIHYLADLLAQKNAGEIPKGSKIKVLDIGTGANCIYPIIGSQAYGWQFSASELDPLSVKTARIIVESNACLNKKIKLISQKNAQSIFHGIIKPEDSFALTMCNPPFHASEAEATQGSQRKWRNLAQNKAQRNSASASIKSSRPLPTKRNFGGQKAELWCEGGELAFLKRMITESKDYANQVGWFTSLVSKKENIRPLKKLLLQCSAQKIEVVKMSQGQKISRFIAWHF
ncbi:MAG: 23S rRNA (adenine(1618)-N(6))-methyltransferase RlmF [Pseudomonadales bacterium]|nr:23S rRNA (adenine(1618)-N(6))-methyltransferase RlmF [Pseudomonadales bacterium]